MLPIWIWIVATSSVEELFVTAKRPEHVGVGWAMVVFQKCLPMPVSLCARLRPSEKTTGERVEKCIMMAREQISENFSRFG